MTGQVESTKSRLPIELIHYEYFINKQDALARERYLKSGFDHEQMSLFLKCTMALLNL